MSSTFQNSRDQGEPVGPGIDFTPNPATGLTIPPKVSPIPSLSRAHLMTQTAAAPFWEQCCLLWTMLATNPLLPDRESHSQVLNDLQNLYRAVHYVVSPEINLVTPLDHSVIESVRVFVVEHLAHVGRALGQSLWNPRC